MQVSKSASSGRLVVTGRIAVTNRPPVQEGGQWARIPRRKVCPQLVKLALKRGDDAALVFDRVFPFLDCGLKLGDRHLAAGRPQLSDFGAQGTVLAHEPAVLALEFLVARAHPSGFAGTVGTNVIAIRDFGDRRFCNSPQRANTFGRRGALLQDFV